MDLYARYDINPRYYRIDPGTTTLALLSPTSCPNGHPWGPGDYLLSTTNREGKVHHRWLCWECRAEWSSVPWPGVTWWPGVETTSRAQ